MTQIEILKDSKYYKYIKLTRFSYVCKRCVDERKFDTETEIQNHLKDKHKVGLR